MFIFLLANVPEALSDFWYLYDLLLVGVIVVCSLFLAVLRRRSNLTEADKALKCALTYLRRAVPSKHARCSVMLLSAQRALSAAIYNLEKEKSDHDRYDLTARITACSEAKQDVEKLLNKAEPIADREIEIIIEELTK